MTTPTRLTCKPGDILSGQLPGYQCLPICTGEETTLTEYYRIWLNDQAHIVTRQWQAIHDRKEGYHPFLKSFISRYHQLDHA